MKIKSFFSLLAMTLIVFLCSLGVAAEKNVRPDLVTSTSKDQTGLAITIYNVNLGLVKDQRTTDLKQGTSELRFMDVAAKVIPTSVRIKSLIDPNSLQILEQNYEYDLLNPQKLLDKYVGKEVKLFTQNPYTEREEVVTATLLSNNGGPIFKIGDDITFGHPGRIIFPGVPENLMAKPTLVWLTTNSLTQAQNIEATYLTNDITWRADYVITLNEKDDRAGLAGWVTIDNKSGAIYNDAKLKLVAGDINRVKEAPSPKMMTDRAVMAARAPEVQQFKEEGFFEYHIYTLQRPATIKDNQTKQISLISAENIPVKKELLLKGMPHFYYNAIGDAMSNLKIGVFVEMENKQKNNLGIPLPKGIVRVYKRDSDGSIQFIGEDSIDHTAKDEKVRVKVGDAFDVVGSRKQTDWKKTARDTYEASFEISLRNHKNEDVIVKVLEPIPGDWQMLNSSHDYKKTEAFTAEFQIPVPKDKESLLTYRVKMRY